MPFIQLYNPPKNETRQCTIRTTFRLQIFSLSLSVTLTNTHTCVCRRAHTACPQSQQFSSWAAVFMPQCSTNKGEEGWINVQRFQKPAAQPDSLVCRQHPHLISKKSRSLCAVKNLWLGAHSQTQIGFSQDDTLGPPVPSTCQGKQEGLRVSEAADSEEEEATIKRKKLLINSWVH